MATTKISADAQQAPASVAGDFSSNLGRALFQQRIETVLLSTQDATGADGLAISLREGDVFVCRASVGAAPEIGVTVEAGQGICGRCIAESKAIVEQELEGDIRSVAAVPVMREGKAFGFVAAFSVQPHAFPQSAIEDFYRLGEVITNQIEPIVEVDLRPEADEGEDELLSQMGIVPDAKATGDGQADDESFLTDLVRDVLENAPSNQAVIAAPVAAEQVLEEHSEEAPSNESNTPRFPSRTTEEVLMQVVDHLPAKPTSAGSAAAAVPAVEEAKAAGPTFKAAAVTPTAGISAHAEPVEFEKKEPGTVEPWTWIRIAIIGAVLLGACGTGWYFIRNSRKAANDTAKTTAAQQNAPTAAAPTTPAPTPNTSATEEKTKPAEQRTARPSESKPQRQPILVASGSAPSRARNAAPDDAPPALNGVPVKISAPELPSSSANVVFGGQRSSGAIPAKLIHRVEPAYPPIAKTMRLLGDVKLDATVGADGRVKSIRTVEGPPVLAGAAQTAVRSWRYDPAKQNGQNVESQVEIIFHFR